MEKPVVLLKDLKEGDEFFFVRKHNSYNGVWSPDSYYVEGQYPKFHCTTVCRKSNVKPCSSGGFHMTRVTGVEDTQPVRLLNKEIIHTCHKVTFNIQ